MSYKKLFFSFFLFSLVLVKLASIYYTNFNLFGDEAQYWIWSQNLDFGYYSKPPFLAWIINIFTILLGSNFFSLKLIPFIFYFFTSYVVFLIALELYSDRGLAFLASISFYLLPSVTVSSFILSTDVVLIFFWSLCLLVLLKIRKQASLLNFLLLGIFLGLAFLTKYAAIYFLLSLFVFLCFDKKLRMVFLQNIFFTFLFFCSCLLVMFPNILWNINNGWITISHTGDNAGLERIGFNPLNGIVFLLTQGMMLGPILVLFFLTSIKKIKKDFQTIFLISFSLPIFFIVLVESVLVRANANWAAVGLVGLFILFFKHTYINSKKYLHISNFTNIVICYIFVF